jgi:hypothetical protein
MSLKMRKAVLLAKAETTYGTDAVPTGGANAILVRNMTITPLDAQYVGRDVIRPYLGHSEQIPVGTNVKLEFEIELAASGIAGVAPAWGAVLCACAFAQTVAIDEVVYTPISHDGPSLSLHYHLDAVRHVLLGARGDVSFKLDANQIPVMQYRFTGLYGGVSDQALPAVDYSAFVQPRAAGKTWTPTLALHGIASPSSGITVNIANEVVHRNLIGHESVVITDRKPAGNLVIEATTVAQKDWWTVARNATLGALQVVHGTEAGNIVELASPRVQITAPQYQDMDGIAMLAANLTFVPDTGNDELVITLR